MSKAASKTSTGNFFEDFRIGQLIEHATPRTVTINEALEIARRFSTYEATQFINGILDAIKGDLDKESPVPETMSEEESESGDSPEATQP